jgi:NAD(P)-dependent dehydrogenase (short-subunit alcohol dehydrogenase family)
MYLPGTAKAGVNYMTKNMALELSRNGIRVNALAPGYFNTVSLLLLSVKHTAVS